MAIRNVKIGLDVTFSFYDLTTLSVGLWKFLFILYAKVSLVVSKGNSFSQLWVKGHHFANGFFIHVRCNKFMSVVFFVFTCGQFMFMFFVFWAEVRETLLEAHNGIQAAPYDVADAFTGGPPGGPTWNVDNKLRNVLRHLFFLFFLIACSLGRCLNCEVGKMCFCS